MTAADTADLRQVTEADVYLGDQLVGTLVREPDDQVSFDYLGTYDPVGGTVRDRSVSWSLLRIGRFPVRASCGAVPPFFAGLLPEGVRLGIVTASTKTSPDDHRTLLLAVGADTIGDVRVAPTGTAPPDRLPMFDPRRDTDFKAVYATTAGSVAADPVGLVGASPDQRRRGDPETEPVPTPGRQRAFFMRMAAACGLRAAKTELLEHNSGTRALLVSRFDRDNGRRIAQEGAYQVARLQVPHQDRGRDHHPRRRLRPRRWIPHRRQPGAAQDGRLLLADRQRRPARQESVDLQTRRDLAADARLRPAHHPALHRLAGPDGP